MIKRYGAYHGNDPRKMVLIANDQVQGWPLSGVAKRVCRPRDLESMRMLCFASRFYPCGRLRCRVSRPVIGGVHARVAGARARFSGRVAPYLNSSQPKPLSFKTKTIFSQNEDNWASGRQRRAVAALAHAAAGSAPISEAPAALPLANEPE